MWAKVNIARFQKIVISNLAFASPDVTLFLRHVVNVNIADSSLDRSPPPFVVPREPLDDYVLLGRARCKVLLVEHTICNEPAYCKR